MRTAFRLPVIAIAFCVASFTLSSCEKQAEKSTTATPSYKDIVVENPTAEADMKVVSDYTNALVSGDLDKAKSLLAANFMGYGPSAADSSNVDKTMTSWTNNYKTQADRKTAFVTQTFKVLSGDKQGTWVSLWGDYYFTQAGKTIKLPYQSTAKVADGKITYSRIYYDNLSVYQAFGYTLTPPETAKK